MRLPHLRCRQGAAWKGATPVPQWPGNTGTSTTTSQDTRTDTGLVGRDKEGSCRTDKGLLGSILSVFTVLKDIFN